MAANFGEYRVFVHVFKDSVRVWDQQSVATINWSHPDITGAYNSFDNLYFDASTVPFIIGTISPKDNLKIEKLEQGDYVYCTFEKLTDNQFKIVPSATVVDGRDSGEITVNVYLTEPAKYLTKTGLAYLWSKITSKLSTKVDKVSGKGLSTNDFTDSYKKYFIKRFNHYNVTVRYLDSEWVSVSSSGSEQVGNIYPSMLNDMMIGPYITDPNSAPTTGDMFIGKGLCPGYANDADNIVYGICYGLAIRFDYTGEAPQVEILPGKILYYFNHAANGRLYIYTGGLPTPSIVKSGTKFFYNGSKTSRYSISGSYSIEGLIS